MEELLGCWREAQRADKVAAHLVRIRNTLTTEFFEHITAVLKEIESSSRLLRDLYDLFPIYRSRVPMIVYYLNIILPSYCKTLQQMTVYVDNDGLSARSQWVLMYERMGEQGGMTLAARFVMFVDFLVQITSLRSDDLGAVANETFTPTNIARHRREGIMDSDQSLIPFVFLAPPGPALPHHAPLQPTKADLETQRRHWAEKIFDDQPHSTTGLRHRRDSKCFGPPMPEVRLGITPGSNVLFKLPFDKNRLSVTLYLQPEGANMTRLLCRWMDKYFNPLYSCYGVHELTVRRKGSSLQFRRWSTNKMHPTLWTALFFKTWEKMVLFHCAFGALKSRCPLTLNITPDDVVLAGEKRLYQGKIVDDGFEHILTVLEDVKCGGLRLHAAVRNGDLRKCPVWTAFVTYQSASPNWMERRSRHRIWLRDLYPYVFCQKYKKKHQMKKHGEFEIYFVNEEAADAFEDVFQDPDDVVEVIEMSGANGPGPSESSDGGS
ncbi:uncharacterized protein PAC_11929 [Phialocephala subalpina]|uniref:Uncharacterized protein n=1 Tax=Phialocephala subalpina TaxID=576137 RepID=A0A1L7XAI6_9HELO|nr:uncharacterized protein PAC_11929 [Phialocephala subalpina]